MRKRSVKVQYILTYEGHKFLCFDKTKAKNKCKKFGIPWKVVQWPDDGLVVRKDIS